MSAEISLKHGNEYPYDATDAWWKDWRDETPVDNSADWMYRAVRGIIADLQDRRDIKRGFEGVSEDIRADIVESLVDIVRLAHDWNEKDCIIYAANTM